MLLLLKAAIRGGAAHDLFATPTQVKGHVREGKFVGPYIALRKQAAPEIAQMHLVFTQHVPMAPTQAFHSQWMSGGIPPWLVAIDKPETT